MIPISKYMIPDPVSVDEDFTVGQTVQLMRARNIGAVLVQNSGAETTGIFTERDLLEKVDLQNSEHFQSLKIRGVMTKGLITVTPDTLFNDVLLLMRAKNLRHMPVKQDGRIVGMVSLRDMMRRYEENLDLALQAQEEKMRAEMAKLEQSEMMFRLIFQHSTTAMIFTDAQDLITTWNETAGRLLGVTDEELRGQPLWVLFPQAEQNKVRAWRQEGKQGGGQLSTWVCHRDGSLVDVDVSLSFLREDQDGSGGLIVALRDTGSRRQSGPALEASMRQMESLRFGLDEHALVAITDSQGVISYVNDKFCAVSGYSREEALGKNYSDLCPAVSVSSGRNALWDEVVQGHSHRGEFEHRHHGASPFWVDLTVTPFLDEHRQLYQVVFMGTDITLRKKEEERVKDENRDLAANVRALRSIAMDHKKSFQKLKEDQEQIIQMEKMATLGTLAAGFAHEIKNPLAIILQGMERVEKICALGPEDPNNQYLAIVKSAAQRADKVVTSILRYSRLSQMEEQEVNIYDVIDEAVELLQNNARFNQVNIRRDYTREAHIVRGDPIMLTQVFFDLFANAFDAMPDGGDIVMTSVVDPSGLPGTGKRSLVIKVKDSGTGIAPELLPRIFEPFFTTKDEGKGTGLGLSTVYLIVNRHNGTITVESQPGQGTAFVITLPLENDTYS